MKIGFIPIDNRPVCYTLPKNIASVDESIEFFMPERDLLGDLTKGANIEKIFEWLSDLPELDVIIVSLDTIAYGGLIPSRRCDETFEQIKKRIEKFKSLINSQKILAFSSIMRISNNNFNEEEKLYWSDYGKKIFEYSYNLDKSNITKTDIPKNILDDYLATRKRNFVINKLYLEWEKEGFFDTLVFSKDDCAEYGLNVAEARELQSLGGFVKTGADEIPLSLLARAIECDINVKPVFLEPDSINLISNYEDVSIKQSALSQLDLGGFKLSENPDIFLYINNFKNNQGEIVMKVPTEPFNGHWETPDYPYMIADVRFANGSDNEFLKQLKHFDEKFYGYSGWNTSANTLGSLICAAKIKFNARKYNKDNFRKLQITRLLDDWAYQANVRQKLKKPDPEKCKELMIPFEKKVFELTGVKFNTKYSFPWNRLFEVEVELF